MSISALPLTLTDTLVDFASAVMDLVCLGEGRWYDPTLDRPLQPNASGDPPTVPQALNRYAATAMGQPVATPVALDNASEYDAAGNRLQTG